jgi:hypothetical protein
MNDSKPKNESVISKNRFKFLYSYSKQSLAPAVSTVGFFLCARKKAIDKKIFVMLTIDVHQPHAWLQYLIFGIFTKLIDISTCN